VGEEGERKGRRDSDGVSLRAGPRGRQREGEQDRWGKREEGIQGGGSRVQAGQLHVKLRSKPLSFLKIA
jgi:hypothetical protein